MAAIERSAPALTCPSCEVPLSTDDGELACPSCSETVPVVDGIARFPVPGDDEPELFDRLSPIYESPLWFQPLYRFVGGPFAPADDRRRLARLLDVDEGDLLDVACGTGRFTRYVADDAASVWGIDRSAGMLERAQGDADRDGTDTVAFARMDATDLHFEDGAFDRVVCTWALHLFPDPGAALAEMRRVLDDGGRIAGTTLTDEYVMRLPGVRYGARRTLGARVFERDELRELLRDAGFSSVELDRRGGALFFAADA